MQTSRNFRLPGAVPESLIIGLVSSYQADFSSSGAADVRQVFEQARNGLKLTGR